MKTTKTMTTKQTKQIERIQSELELKLAKQHSNNLELKVLDFEVSEHGQVFLTLEYGSKNDEGTMAEAHCRNSYLIVIGKRGGLTSLSKDCPAKYKHTMFGVTNWNF